MIALEVGYQTTQDKMQYILVSLGGSAPRRRTRSDSVRSADLHPHVASSAHDVPLPLGGSEGAQPPTSPCRGPAKRGPKG